MRSILGRDYLGAMRAAINCALANRQILTHLVRQVFARVLPQARLPVLYARPPTGPGRHAWSRARCRWSA